MWVQRLVAQCLVDITYRPQTVKASCFGVGHAECALWFMLAVIYAYVFVASRIRFPAVCSSVGTFTLFFRPRYLQFFLNKAAQMKKQAAYVYGFTIVRITVRSWVTRVCLHAPQWNGYKNVKVLLWSRYFFCGPMLQAKTIVSDNYFKYVPVVYLTVFQPLWYAVIIRNGPSHVFA